MKTISLSEFTPQKYYIKTPTAQHFLFPDIEHIENYRYHITNECQSFFLLTLKGESDMRYENGLHIVSRPGFLTYVPPAYIIDKYSESNDYEYLRLDLKIYDKSDSDIVRFFEQPTLLSENTPNTVRNIMFNALNYCTDSPQAQSRIYALILNFIVEIGDIVISSPNNNFVMPKIQKVIKYLNDNYIRNDSSEFLAQLSGLSEPYFRKCFKSITNMTPMEYRNSKRIEKGKEMLLIGNDSVKYISYHIGFEDTNYFSRTFKKFTGLSPKNYRKAHFKE